MAARRLNTYVHVDGEWYGPDDDVPAAAARRIGAHAWADADQDADTGPADDGQAPTPTSAGEAPPRTGRGSGVEAWRTFAEQHGVKVDEDMNRDEIIAAAEAAGVVEREE